MSNILKFIGELFNRRYADLTMWDNLSMVAIMLGVILVISGVVELVKLLKRK